MSLNPYSLILGCLLALGLGFATPALPSVAPEAPHSPEWARSISPSAPGSAPGAAQSADEEILKEFKKYFRKYKETMERVEAVLALEDVESVKVVPVLLKLLKDKEVPVRDTAIRVLSSFESRGPVDALLLALSEESDSVKRAGMLKALEGGAYPHDGAAVLPCLEDRDWLVRRAALKALAVLKNAEVVPAMVPLIADSEAGVRSAAIDSLAKLRAVEMVAPTQQALVDPVWQVRGSAIAALGVVRDVTSIPLLIERMEQEEGRLVDDLSLSLDRLTGRGLIKEASTWRSFWDAYGDKYTMPTDEEIAKILAKRAANRAKYDPKKGSTSYHGVETPSRSILFVIDVSGSMEDEVTEKDRFKDGNYPSYSRMDITKTELARTIAGLEPHVKFNILSFATKVKRWKKGLVSANVLNKSSAESWIKALEPIGGNSKADMAAVGFTSLAALDQGKTNTWEALATAMSLPLDPNKAKPKKDHYRIDVDTIFFLSDGRPTTGYYIKTEAILEKILEANELRKVVIHTIAIGEFQKVFMKLLAEKTGGVFVDLGR